jgi:F-type H+-transporting ATPase subunit a
VNKWLIVAGVLILMIVGFVFFRLPQPIIEIAPEALFHLGGFTITNTIVTSWVMIALIALITILGTRKLTLIPSGFQNVFEALIEGFGNLVSSVAGEKNGRRFFPVVFILFFYIVFCNWMALTPLFNFIGLVEDEYHHIHHEAAEHPDAIVAEAEEIQGHVLKRGGITTVPLFVKTPLVKVKIPAGVTYEHRARLMDEELARRLGTDPAHPLAEDQTYGLIAPFLRGVNTDLNSPLGYAFWSAIFVEFWGVTALGFFSYVSKFFNFRGPIDFFVGILELISEFARLISFTFRLFGNIFAGEVLLFMMSFLVPFVLVDVFYGLELFVGLIQGFVFAMLTLVFGVMAVSGHGDHESHEDGRHSGEHDAAHA